MFDYVYDFKTFLKIHTKADFKICFLKLTSLVNTLRVLRNIRHGPGIRWKKGGEVMPGNRLIKTVCFTDAVYATCFHYIHYLRFSPKPKNSISSRRKKKGKACFRFYHVSGSKFQDERRLTQRLWFCLQHSSGVWLN